MNELYSQNQFSVKGVVKAEESGEALPGATVYIKGTTDGTVTNHNGEFTITTDKGQTLIISFMGYLPKEVLINNELPLDIHLLPDSKNLDEVVIVGYGTMKRSDLTGAVISIGKEEIEQGVNTSLEQAMQGRVAGVQVMQNSGQPGGGISVSIRGINSLNGNEPLYVIDGVAISGQSSENSSVLASLNPADVTSMEVLKDASATAIYGSRASNGVVLITTNRGQTGKPKLTYESYVGWQQLPTKLEVMDLQDYAEFYNTRAEIRGWGEREAFRDPSLLSKGTDWQDLLFRTALMHNHQAGISGGTDNVNYALSTGFLNQEGIALGSDFHRATFRSNIDAEITKWFKIGSSVSYANTKQTVTFDDANLIQTALNQTPDISPYNADGSYGFVEENSYNTYYSNPLFEALEKENYNNGSQFFYNTFANLNPIEGLNLRVEYGGEIKNGNSYYYQPEYQYGTVISESESKRGSSKSNYWSFKSYLTYDFSLLAIHKFQLMAGHEVQESNWENLWGSRKGYISDEIHSLDVGDVSTAKNGNGGNTWALESYYGRLNYNFNDRYLLTATIRTDGSSNLGQNNRWGIFPSTALAWRINNESFMENIKTIDNLKLRLGWGIVGNQNASSYAYGTIMSNTTTAWGTGYYPGNYSNPDLQWEETEAYNIGLDLALFKNRIEFITDIYYKNTDNLLMKASLPSYITDSEGIGLSAPWVNAGAMQNKGIEFTLNTVNVDKGGFFWSTGLTLSFNRNKITKLYSDESVIYGRLGDDVYTASEVGQPVGQFFGYNVIGMFTKEDDFYTLNEVGESIPVARPSNTDGELYDIAENSIWLGDYIFEDVNEDGKIDEKDRKYIGNPNPDFTFGINNAFTYKNFELQLFINGSYGNDVYNVLRQEHTNPLGYNNKMQEVSSYARIDKIDQDGGDELSNLYVSNAESASVQRISAAGSSNNNNNRISNRFVEDGSYIRLKSISLAYNLPKEWTQKVQINKMQIYLKSQNLFTIAAYSGYDPEIGALGQNITLMGLDNGRYPSQRIYTAGLKLNF